LFGTGLMAGFVDSIAGGGGLITLPVFLSLGLPPKFALGTNKLQAVFGSWSAAIHHVQSKVVSLRECRLGIFCTLVGAVCGTLLVQLLNPVALKHLIPVVLIAIALYMVFKPQLGEGDIHPRTTPEKFYTLAGLGLGFYDGFIGPGTGTFWTMALMLGLGFNFTKATGYTKVMNATSNFASVVFFLAKGQTYFAAGITMGVGQLLGAKIGSHMVVTRGAKFIRPIFLAMVFVLILKLLYDSYSK
jgi:uncharacterized membrane protein YfcA